MTDRYEIRVRGHLAPCWSEYFAGWTLSHTQGGDTLLAGPVLDQAALHGLLARVRDLNLTLISLNRMAAERSKEEQNERPE